MYIYIYTCIHGYTLTYSGRMSIRYSRKSPFFSNSNTIRYYERTLNVILMSVLMCLTGSPIVTTPRKLTMLGCLNWLMTAASCRNLTFSLLWSDLTATSIREVDFELRFRSPLLTVP